MPAVPARVSTTYFATDPTEVRVSVCVVVRRSDDSREILLMRRSDNAHWGLTLTVSGARRKVKLIKSATSPRGK